MSTSWTPVLEAQAATRLSCGSGSSWDVKVGTDPQAKKIDQNSAPTAVTIAQLTSLRLPSTITHRVQPTEATVFVTTARINDIYVEHDSDTHLAIDDGTTNAATRSGHFMIAELPDIRCVPKTSVFYSGIQRAHSQLSAWGGHPPVTARITGVGFFDSYTGQPDQAHNQIELHSVLDLNINPGSITGQLTNSAGGAVSGASASDGVDPAVLTNSNGIYTIPNVAANASYTVTASASGFSTQSKAVAVTYGKPSTANITLSPSPMSGAVSGTVKSASGGAVISGATVSDTGGATTTTDSAGIYTVTGLSPGGHTLTASTAGFTSGTQTASVTTGTTTQNVNFGLAPNTSGVPQLVQATGASEILAATSLTGTFSIPTSARHLLVLSASVYTGTTNPITYVADSGGNIWNKIGAFVVAGHYSDGEMWYAANASPVTSVTVRTVTPAVVSLEIQEFSGVATSSPLDRSTGTANTSSSPDSGSVTPTAAGDLVVGFLAGHSSAQAISVSTAGYTAQGQQTSSGGASAIATVVTAYKVLTLADSQRFTGSFPSAMYWAAGIAGFRAGS